MDYYKFILGGLMKKKAIIYTALIIFIVLLGCALGIRNLQVIYDANNATGGTVPEDNLKYKSGDEVTVRANSGNLVRTGWNYMGWNTSADGSGANYEGGETFTIGVTDQILYAHWWSSPPTTAPTATPEGTPLPTSAPTQIPTPEP